MSCLGSVVELRTTGQGPTHGSEWTLWWCIVKDQMEEDYEENEKLESKSLN